MRIKAPFIITAEIVAIIIVVIIMFRSGLIPKSQMVYSVVIWIVIWLFKIGVFTFPLPFTDVRRGGNTSSFPRGKEGDSSFDDYDVRGSYVRDHYRDSYGNGWGDGYGGWD